MHTTTTLHFLPGAAGDPSFWQPVASHLTKLYPNYGSLLQHYPAFAGHANHEGIDSLSGLSDWVLSQIKQPSILIAQSMGGIFALQAALQHPHLVQALVLCATSGGIDLSHFDVDDWHADYRTLFPDAPDWFMQSPPQFEPQLQQINIPILLLWGELDAISPPRIGHYLQQQLIQAELQIIPNGQHDFASVHAELTATHIANFLRKLGY